jgi:hypothetical protein
MITITQKLINNKVQSVLKLIVYYLNKITIIQYKTSLISGTDLVCKMKWRLKKILNVLRELNK